MTKLAKGRKAAIGRLPFARAKPDGAAAVFRSPGRRGAPRGYFFGFTLGLSSAFRSPSAYCMPARMCSSIGFMA